MHLHAVANQVSCVKASPERGIEGQIVTCDFVVVPSQRSALPHLLSIFQTPKHVRLVSLHLLSAYLT